MPTDLQKLRNAVAGDKRRAEEEAWKWQRELQRLALYPLNLSDRIFGMTQSRVPPEAWKLQAARAEMRAANASANATAAQGLQIGRGTAVHIRNEEFDFLTPLCGGTRTNGPAQAKRLVSAAPTCKACLKAAAK